MPAPAPSSGFAPPAARWWTPVVLAIAVAGPGWALATISPLPLADYPQHLGTIAAMHGQGSATWASYFAVDTGPVQYLLYYLLSDWLAYLVGVEAAARLVLVAGLAGLPLAVAALLRAHGRPALWGAAASAVSIHVFVAWGFINYCMAITVALLALAALAALVRDGGWWSAALYGGLALLLFYTHAQLYAWMALAAAVQGAAMVPDVGRGRAFAGAGRGVAAAVPSVGAALLWVSRSGVLDSGVAGRRGGAAATVAEEAAKFEGWREAAAQWGAHSFDMYVSTVDSDLAYAFQAVLLVLLLWRAAAFVGRLVRHAPADTDASSQGVAARTHALLAPEAVLLTAVACALFAPVSFKLIEPISHRFMPLAIALLPVLGPVRRPRNLPAIAAGLMLIALSLYAGGVHTTELGKAAAEAGRLDDALARTKPGRRLVGLIFDRYSDVMNTPTWLHAHQYYQVRPGGLAAFGFVEFPISPLVYRYAAAPPAFEPRFEWQPETFDYGKYGEHFDYFLVRSVAGRPAPRFWGDADPPPRLIFESPRWRLYARIP